MWLCLKMVDLHPTCFFYGEHDDAPIDSKIPGVDITKWSYKQYKQAKMMIVSGNASTHGL